MFLCILIFGVAGVAMSNSTTQPRQVFTKPSTEMKTTLELDPNIFTVTSPSSTEGPGNVEMRSQTSKLIWEGSQPKN